MAATRSRVGIPQAFDRCLTSSQAICRTLTPTNPLPIMAAFALSTLAKRYQNRCASVNVIPCQR
jgi:hypothetical protein